MIQQKDILQWLNKFTINQIKHLLTIKNPLNLDYLRMILSFKPETKPKQRMEHGYSENKIKEHTTIYQRDKFRYKKNKQQKKQMDQCLLENITVSRQNPWSLSVTKSFIRNDKLRECMLLLSDGNIFTFVSYPLIKSGSDSQSFWFKTTNISSFSEWLIHFFEIEIKEAYQTREPLPILNFFGFAEQCLNIQIVKHQLIQIISIHTDKSNNSKTPKKEKKNDEIDPLEITKQQSLYLLQKCLQKFKQGTRDLGEVIAEYEWFSTDVTSKINRVLKTVHQVCICKYNSYQIDRTVKQIEDMATPNKKKKKKNKKNKDQNRQFGSDVQEDKKQKQAIKQSCSKQQVPFFSQTPKIKRLKSQDKYVLQKNQKKQQQNLNFIKQYQKKYSKQQLTSFSHTKHIQDTLKYNKIMQQRISQFIHFYFLKLYQSSATLNKHRQVCIQIIQAQIKSIKIPYNQQLVLFGSYSIDFTIKQSDLDFVLIIESQSCEQIMYKLKEHLKATKWLRNCNIVHGKIISILQFEIMLSQIQHIKIKDNKKLINTIIHVDISVTNSKNNECLRNTKFMKQLLQSYPDLKIIGLILKELLKIANLNKNYTGGIGSYMLVMLIFNILKIKAVNFDGNYLNQLIFVAKYMSQEFIPYQTLISSSSNTKQKADPRMALNIEDPQSGALLKTNAKQINLIIRLFTELYNLLKEIQQICSKIQLVQRKKMKRLFFREWDKLFKPEQQLTQTLE